MDKPVILEERRSFKSISIIIEAGHSYDVLIHTKIIKSDIFKYKVFQR